MNESEMREYLGVDAEKWAEEFGKLGAVDGEVVRAWFSCAIMAGYDYRDNQQRRYDSPETRGKVSPALRGERPVVSYETPE